ncbi:hypothetical protein B7494_g5535 [Chlorociboria aeruginascens]|nr:hypothetical protein B7494_g5535 [Chlorociboria aeruginascens]
MAPSALASPSPVPGVSVPTAPRSQRVGRPQITGKTPISLPNIEVQSKSYVPEKPRSDRTPSTISDITSPSKIAADAPEPKSAGVSKKPIESPVKEAGEIQSEETKIAPIDSRKRRPFIGRRIIPLDPEAESEGKAEGADEASDAESDDGIDDDYFENEISMVRAEMSKILENNELMPRLLPSVLFLRPFIDPPNVDLTGASLTKTEDCIPPKVNAATELEVPIPKPRGRRKSRAPTPSTSVAELEGQSSASVDQEDTPAESLVSGPGEDVKDTKVASIVDHRLHAPLPAASTPVVGDSVKISSNDRPTRNKPTIERPEESEDEQTEAEALEALESVRKWMTTPPRPSLPMFNSMPFDKDPAFMRNLETRDPVVEAYIRDQKKKTAEQRKKEQYEEAELWRARYIAYRNFTDRSYDDSAVRSRDKFAKDRELAEKEANASAAATTTTPASEARPEGQRRTGSRWATEHDLERVLRESKEEAKNAQEREERSARAKTAGEKEATIPLQYWDEEEAQENLFKDQTHLVPFERSFARLEFGEPLDNFTEQETEIFEALFLEAPKEWGKIAANLQRRDYKACIQHYYLIKHTTGLKDKIKKRGRGRKGKPPRKVKSSSLISDLGNRDNNGDDNTEVETGSERRGRPRRAAAMVRNAAPAWPLETPGDGEMASPAATPGRKPGSVPKGEAGSDAAPPKKKSKVPRGEKVSKQAKNSQLLAAAPPNTTRLEESPTAPPPLYSTPRPGSGGTNRFPAQFEGAVQTQPNFAPPYIPLDNSRPSSTIPTNLDSTAQTFTDLTERFDSAPPMGLDAQPDRRSNVQQTSSYWSVPEQTDFPALLRYFGTDWHAIANFMTTKTHIMVYTTAFQQWLTVPSDSNKSQHVANIQSQVKNYYQRQVETKIQLGEIARDADEKIARGESTGPLPNPTLIPKRRYDVPGSLPRSGSALDNMDDLAPSAQSMMIQQNSPQQPPISTRFPALAQAGPVPHPLIQPAVSSPVPTVHLHSQPALHTPPQLQQQLQQQIRPRGPALGFFNTDSQRPIMQATSQPSAHQPPSASEQSRSRMTAMAQEEARIEKQQALKIEQQAIQVKRDREQRERHQMKQESEMPNVHQYEPYSGNMRPSLVAQSRPEAPLPGPIETRRTVPQHQFQQLPQTYQPRQAVRSFLGDNVGKKINLSPSPSAPRPPMSAPPSNNEKYPAPQPQPAPVQQDPVRKTSNIMSLLNDEPNEPRPPPAKRVSDVTTPLEVTQTPPPQHPLQASRYSVHRPQPTPTSRDTMQPMMAQAATQPSLHNQHYGQPPSHPLHQHAATVPARSYTPTGLERSYAPPPPPVSISQQQPMYSHQPRHSISSQQSTTRREPSLSELQGITSGYPRSAAPQSSMRLKESPYSAPLPQQTPGPRQQLASPLDHPSAAERDYYSRSQHLIQGPSSATNSPRLAQPYTPSLHPAPPPNHRQIAFGGQQSRAHAASPPPPQYSQHPLHNSRHGSLDGRYVPGPPTSAPPSQQSYMPPQYPQYPQERFESGYDREERERIERHRRYQEEEYNASRRRMEEGRR